MDPAALTEVEDEFFVRMETRTPPYGAAAVYCRARSLYLAFPTPPPRTKPARASPSASTVLLGEGEAADGDRLYLTDDTLFRMLEQPRRAARSSAAPRRLARHDGYGHGNHHPRPRGR